MTFDRRDEEIRRALEELGPALDDFRVGDAPDHLLERTLRRARGQLLAPARRAETDVGSPVLPPGFKRELARLLVLIAPIVALTVVSMAFLWERLPQWLGAWLPTGVAGIVTGAWGLGAVTLLSLTCGSLPFFAHQRVLRASARESEATEAT